MPFSSVVVCQPCMVHTRIHCGLFVVSRDSAVEKGGGIKISNQNGGETKERYV